MVAPFWPARKNRVNKKDKVSSHLHFCRPFLVIRRIGVQAAVQIGFDRAEPLRFLWMQHRSNAGNCGDDSLSASD